MEPVSLLDIRAILATCERRTFTGDRDRAIVLALLDSGCRASEFLALNIEDVNLAAGAVIVREGKGRKLRTVFVGTKARRETMRYLRHRPGAKLSESLWVAAGGKRLTYGGLRSVARRRANKVGVPTCARRKRHPFEKCDR